MGLALPRCLAMRIRENVNRVVRRSGAVCLNRLDCVRTRRKNSCIQCGKRCGILTECIELFVAAGAASAKRKYQNHIMTAILRKLYMISVLVQHAYIGSG